ncbi:ALI_HP2_G0054070.mRNA.1.CDS.1 [Saccharomyces cerevisiae]|nr:ALI_HP2_G0054070.mRNA.1.CDS.1 [Saccharomyces cerevisiae]CAI6811015.1 ALI_HP2_G0054070.mRNA.1.CDS.1 [Saccharomyces cerevisiae]CAI6821956.1 ALI_HP1_G0054800.mRNA.1.CDS.1 [Saccharomyces cerevisiae]CAI6913793.1 ALI_collapsed_G0056450.mRNA.1.CDS.1 [Saccharomyces cerevisiae]
MYEVIQKRKTKIINVLQNPELMRLIEDPSNLGISLHFPVSSLLKIWLVGDLRIGARDIPLDVPPEVDIIDFYWDVILCMESQFILDYNVPSKNKGNNQKSVAKLLKNKLVNDMKNTLKRLIYNENTKQYKNNNSHDGYNWRKLGSQYFILYLPLFTQDLIWCKLNENYFHVVLPSLLNSRNVHDNHSTYINKDWLLALLELTSNLNQNFKFEYMKLRLYILRDDLINNGLDLLKNLNWVGGKLIKNEDREVLLNSADLATDSISHLLGDENFVILEFEC